MRFILAALLALSFELSAFALDANGVHWNEQATEHFDVRYRSAWMPSGLAFTLEGIHQKLEFNIGILNPTLLGAKKRFVLYATREEYLQGAFHPPSWSQGIAYPDQRALVMYEMEDKESFRTTMAHEMTHLLVGAYFKEKKRYAPRWLDEGLAMLMEERAIPVTRPDAYWNAARALLPRDSVLPMELFAGTEPKSDDDKMKVRDWYFQSYLMTRWLFLEHSKLQFKSFCDAVRDGEDLRFALQKVYGIRDLAHFDQAWVQYAGLPAARPRAAEAGEPKAKPFMFKAADFADFSATIYQKKEAAK